MWRDRNGNRVHPSLSPTHITSMSLHVLPKIHFPSLKRLEFRFPSSNFPNELRDSFVNMAIGLESASNLEELHIDMSLVMKFDNFYSQMIFEVFSKNLAKCKKLKRIKILNQFKGQGVKSDYSIGLLLALIPAIEKGVSTLEEVTLLIGNAPTTKPTSKAYINAAHDLFVAILSLQRLKEFNLQLNLASSPLLNIFLQAANQVYQISGTLPSSDSIEKFTLASKLYTMPEGVVNPLPTPVSLAPCLALLGESSSLHKFVVRVPSACWDSNSASALKNLLSHKPKMRHLGLYFNGYECTSGRCLSCILDYMQERENMENFPNLIHVSGLECYNTRHGEEEALERYYSREGEKCLSWDENGLVFTVRGYFKRW